MNVTIYSTSTCSSCKTLEQWLDSKNVSYKVKITDESDELMNEFMTVNDGMIGVPFTVIETDDGRTEKVAGYDQSQFKRILAIA